MRYGLRYDFSSSETEVLEFVEGNQCVKRWVSRYGKGSESFLAHARALCMFFKWLQHVKGQDLGPKEFLVQLTENWSSSDPDVKMWGNDLALEFTRDNPLFQGKSWSYKYGLLFGSIRRFCAANQVILSLDRGGFGESNVRKFKEPAFTMDDARKVLGLLNVRDQAICLCMLQSGQSIRQILVDLNGQVDYVMGEIEKGKQRVRVDFQKRKNNNRPYFSFVGAVAVHALEKWLFVRAQWLKSQGKTSGWLFVTEKCEQLSLEQFDTNFRCTMQRKKLWKGPYSVRPHMFRKLFEQESSPPDRGVSRDYVVFMMGHGGGNGRLNGALDGVGGTYDKKPFGDPSVVEREYAKLERFLDPWSLVHDLVNLDGSSVSQDSLLRMVEQMIDRKLGK